MMKWIKQSIIILIAASIIASSIPIRSEAAEAFTPEKHGNGIRLVINSENREGLPKHFRKASDRVDVPEDKKINLVGLSSLNISGSHQFSEKELASIKHSIGGIPITVVDLRQESHGFINGIAVSWRNKNNNANQGLTKEQVLQDENSKLTSITLSRPVTLYDHNHETVIPKKVQNEQKHVESMGMKYVRIPVTDGALPANNMVDYFIEFVKLQPRNSWIHFHCGAGVGRTTLFMIMYDMMKNAKQVGEEDIIERQLLLADLGEKGRERFLSNERVNFLNDFYKYCRENADNFSTPWSKWISAQ